MTNDAETMDMMQLGNKPDFRIDKEPMSSYNSLLDPHLAGFFASSRMKRHLRKAGLINRQGEVLSESTYRINLVRRRKNLTSQSLDEPARLKMKTEEEVPKLEFVCQGDGMKTERLPQIALENSADQRSSRSSRSDEVRSTSAPANVSSRRRDNSQTKHENKNNGWTSHESEGNEHHHHQQQQQQQQQQSNGLSIRQRQRQAVNNITHQDIKAYWDTSLTHHSIEYKSAVSPYLMPLPLPPELPTPRIAPRTAVSYSAYRRFQLTDGNHGQRHQSRLSAKYQNHEPPCDLQIPPRGRSGQQNNVASAQTQSTAANSCPILQTIVTMQYFGSHLELNQRWLDPRDDVIVEQQHCGGNTVIVYRERISPGTVFSFTSRRHPGFPFSLTLYVNGRQDTRLSTCCECKHSTGTRLGGRTGRFGLVSVENGVPCESCEQKAEAKSDKSNKIDYDLINKSRLKPIAVTTSSSQPPAAAAALSPSSSTDTRQKSVSRGENTGHRRDNVTTATTNGDGGSGSDKPERSNSRPRSDKRKSPRSRKSSSSPSNSRRQHSGPPPSSGRKTEQSAVASSTSSASTRSSGGKEPSRSYPKPIIHQKKAAEPEHVKKESSFLSELFVERPDVKSSDNDVDYFELYEETEEEIIETGVQTEPEAEVAVSKPADELNDNNSADEVMENGELADRISAAEDIEPTESQQLEVINDEVPADAAHGNDAGPGNSSENTTELAEISTNGESMDAVEYVNFEEKNTPLPEAEEAVEPADCRQQDAANDEVAAVAAAADNVKAGLTAENTIDEAPIVADPVVVNGDDEPKELPEAVAAASADENAAEENNAAIEAAVPAEEDVMEQQTFDRAEEGDKEDDSKNEKPSVSDSDEKQSTINAEDETSDHKSAEKAEESVQETDQSESSKQTIAELKDADDAVQDAEVAMDTAVALDDAGANGVDSAADVDDETTVAAVVEGTNEMADAMVESTPKTAPDETVDADSSNCGATGETTVDTEDNVTTDLNVREQSSDDCAAGEVRNISVGDEHNDEVRTNESDVTDAACLPESADNSEETQEPATGEVVETNNIDERSAVNISDTSVVEPLPSSDDLVESGVDAGETSVPEQELIEKDAEDSAQQAPDSPVEQNEGAASVEDGDQPSHETKNGKPETGLDGDVDTAQSDQVVASNEDEAGDCNSIVANNDEPLESCYPDVETNGNADDSTNTQTDANGDQQDENEAAGEVTDVCEQNQLTDERTVSDEVEPTEQTINGDNKTAETAAADNYDDDTAVEASRSQTAEDVGKNATDAEEKNDQLASPNIDEASLIVDSAQQDSSEVENADPGQSNVDEIVAEETQPTKSDDSQTQREETTNDSALENSEASRIASETADDDETENGGGEERKNEPQSNGDGAEAVETTTESLVSEPPVDKPAVTSNEEDVKEASPLTEEGDTEKGVELKDSTVDIATEPASGIDGGVYSSDNGDSFADDQLAGTEPTEEQSIADVGEGQIAADLPEPRSPGPDEITQRKPTSDDSQRSDEDTVDKSSDEVAPEAVPSSIENGSNENHGADDKTDDTAPDDGPSDAPETNLIENPATEKENENDEPISTGDNELEFQKEPEKGVSDDERETPPCAEMKSEQESVEHVPPPVAVSPIQADELIDEQTRDNDNKELTENSSPEQSDERAENTSEAVEPTSDADDSQTQQLADDADAAANAGPVACETDEQRAPDITAAEIENSGEKEKEIEETANEEPTEKSSAAADDSSTIQPESNEMPKEPVESAVEENSGELAPADDAENEQLSHAAETNVADDVAEENTQQSIDETVTAPEELAVTDNNSSEPNDEPATAGSIDAKEATENFTDFERAVEVTQTDDVQNVANDAKLDDSETNSAEVESSPIERQLTELNEDENNVHTLPDDVSSDVASPGNKTDTVSQSSDRLPNDSECAPDEKQSDLKLDTPSEQPDAVDNAAAAAEESAEVDRQTTTNHVPEHVAETNSNNAADTEMSSVANKDDERHETVDDSPATKNVSSTEVRTEFDENAVDNLQGPPENGLDLDEKPHNDGSCAGEDDKEKSISDNDEHATGGGDKTDEGEVNETAAETDPVADQPTPAADNIDTSVNEPTEDVSIDNSSSSNGENNDGQSQILSLKEHIQSQKDIELSGIELSPQQVDEVSELLTRHEVTSLMLRNTSLTDSLLEQIAKSLNNNGNSLKYVNFNCNNITSAGIDHVLHLLEHNPSIDSLSIHENPIGDEGIQKLVQGLLNLAHLEQQQQQANASSGDPLHQDDVNDNNAHQEHDEDDMNKQTISGNNESATLRPLGLRMLDIGACGMTSAGAKFVAELIAANIGLSSFSLTGNKQVDIDGWSAVGEALKLNNQLNQLELHHNGFGDAAVAVLVDGLARNQSIVTLDLEGNQLTDEGAQQIVELLKLSTTTTGLRNVQIRSGNSITDAIVDEIEQMTTNR